MDNEPLKWTKILDILETVNGLGDEIRFNSMASQLICDPKIYTTEIADVRQISFIDIFMEKAVSINNSSYVHVNGVADMKIFSSKENRNILDTRIPNQFIWKGYLPNYGSDLQGIFDSFSLSMTDQIFTTLSNFIKTSSY